MSLFSKLFPRRAARERQLERALNLACDQLLRQQAEYPIFETPAPATTIFLRDILMRWERDAANSPDGALDPGRGSAWLLRHSEVAAIRGFALGEAKERVRQDLTRNENGSAKCECPPKSSLAYQPFDPVPRPPCCTHAPQASEEVDNSTEDPSERSSVAEPGNLYRLAFSEEWLEFEEEYMVQLDCPICGDRYAGVNATDSTWRMHGGERVKCACGAVFSLVEEDERSHDEPHRLWSLVPNEVLAKEARVLEAERARRWQEEQRKLRHIVLDYSLPASPVTHWLVNPINRMHLMLPMMKVGSPRPFYVRGRVASFSGVALCGKHISQGEHSPDRYGYMEGTAEPTCPGCLAALRAGGVSDESVMASFPLSGADPTTKESK